MTVFGEGTDFAWDEIGLAGDSKAQSRSVVIIGVERLSEALLNMECGPFLLEETMPKSFCGFGNIKEIKRGRSRNFAIGRKS